MTDGRRSRSRSWSRSRSPGGSRRDSAHDRSRRRGDRSRSPRSHRRSRDDRGGRRRSRWRSRSRSPDHGGGRPRNREGSAPRRRFDTGDPGPQQTSSAAQDLAAEQARAQQAFLQMRQRSAGATASRSDPVMAATPVPQPLSPSEALAAEQVSPRQSLSSTSRHSF